MKTRKPIIESFKCVQRFITTWNSLDTRLGLGFLRRSRLWPPASRYLIFPWTRTSSIHGVVRGPDKRRLKQTFTLYFILLFFLPVTMIAGELKPFTTDGCSSFLDGTLDQKSLWMNCCIRHDLAYWKGGTYNERLRADEALKSCVANTGKPEIAEIMLTGVRVGGTPFLPTPYRWGFGWPYPRGYKALTDAEKIEVKDTLEQLKSMINSLSDELD